MQKADAQMKIRLPDDLKLRIERSAREGGRSLNSEIVRRLEQTFSTSLSFEVKETYSQNEFENILNIMNNRIESLENIINKLVENR